MSVNKVPPGWPVGRVPTADAHGSDAPSASEAVTGADARNLASEVIDARPGDATGRVDHVADISRALDAREIAPEEAVDALVDHGIETVAWAGLSEPERLALRQTLLSLVHEDPVLSGMAARLGVHAASDGSDLGPGEPES